MVELEFEALADSDVLTDSNSLIDSDKDSDETDSEFEIELETESLADPE